MMVDRSIHGVLWVVGALCLFAAPWALAQPAPMPNDNLTDPVLQPFRDLWGDANTRNLLIDAGRNLFFSLALIEMVITAGLMALRPHGGDLSAFAAFMIQRILLIGVFLFFLTNGWVIAQAVVATALWAGGAVSGGVNLLRPSDIVDLGVNLITTWWNQLSVWDFASAASLGLVAVLFSTVWLFILLAGQVMVALAELYIMMLAGIFLLGFGGASVTRQIAIQYFHTVIGSGLKLLTMYIIVGAGYAVVRDWAEAMIAGEIGFVRAVGLMTALAIVWQLARYIPDMASNMFRGLPLGQAGGVYEQIGGVRETRSYKATTGVAVAVGTKVGQATVGRVGQRFSRTAEHQAMGTGASRASAQRENVSVPGPGGRR